MVGDTPAELLQRLHGFTERVIPWKEVKAGEDSAGELLVKPRDFKISTDERNEFKVTSSRTGEIYVIRQLGEAWSCTCKGFQFRRYCKHIKLKQEEKDVHES